MTVSRLYSSDKVCYDRLILKGKREKMKKKGRGSIKVDSHELIRQERIIASMPLWLEYIDQYEQIVCFS